VTTAVFYASDGALAIEDKESRTIRRLQEGNEYDVIVETAIGEPHAHASKLSNWPHLSSLTWVKKRHKIGQRRAVVTFAAGFTGSHDMVTKVHCLSSHVA